jgi:hypothetical protein
MNDVVGDQLPEPWLRLVFPEGLGGPLTLGRWMGAIKAHLEKGARTSVIDLVNRPAGAPAA